MKALRALTGWLAVATKEGRATILSPRFVIIASVLALAVLGGTYSIVPSTGFRAAEQVVYGFTYWPELNRSDPAMAVFVTSLTGEPLSGATVQLVRVEGRDREVLEEKQTDGGWARFDDLASRWPDDTLLLIVPGDPTPQAIAITSPDWTEIPRDYYGILSARFVYLGVADRQPLSLVFLDSRGAAVVGADVSIWKPDEFPDDPFHANPPGGWEAYRNGTTGPNGHFLRPDPLSPGTYLVHAEQGDLNGTTMVSFSGSADPLSQGPDGVLAFVGVTFLSFLLPVVALVLGYDAISRERSEGSLDLLLSQPVGRVGVAVGKVVGAFGSAALPVVVVLTASALLIWSWSGSAPTLSFVGTFLAIALFALFSYTVVFLAISALMKNMGSALLVSVLLFLLFTIFWGLVSALIAGLVAQPGSPLWYDTRVAASLFTPTGVYQQWLTLAAPSLAGGFFGPIGGSGTRLESWVTAVAATTWTVGPMALFLWTMKYRLGEG